MTARGDLAGCGILNREEKYQEAIHVFEGLSNDDLSEPTDLLYFNVGNSYMYGNQFSRAAQCYKRALNMKDVRDGNVGHVLHNMGDCYYRMNREATALKYYKMALGYAETAFELGMEKLRYRRCLLR